MRPRSPRAFAGAACLLVLAGCVPRAHEAPHADRASEVSRAVATDAPPVTPAPAPAAILAPVDTSTEGTPATDQLVPLAVPTSIEDPSGRALAAFHAALQRAETGAGQTRIVYYGASHVASDTYTGVVRELLQRRFGDAGPGFVMPAKPWRWYLHAGVEVERSRGFKAVRIKASAPREDVYGLSGVAFDADARQAAHTALRTVTQGASTPGANRIELAYLAQPHGGRISIAIDGQAAQTLSTDAPEVTPRYARFDATEGPHRIELRTHRDGPVRVFGVALERDAAGVVLDTLGIPGSRARYQLHWNDAVYREHLAWRRPDLVVLAYGTNESGDDSVPIAEEEERVRSVIARVRETVPGASCLLVGPSDRPLAMPDGTYEPRTRTEQLIEMQRRLAGEHGCGFFDVVAFMGGPLSMLRWAAATPALGGHDLVHFTRAGYERLGQVLHAALLEGYPPAASAVAR